MFETKSLKEIRAALARHAVVEEVDPAELFPDLAASQNREADLLRSVRDLSQAIGELKTKPPKAKPRTRTKKRWKVLLIQRRDPPDEPGGILTGQVSL